MTDRELLKYAAKAAGHKIVEWTKDGNGVEVAIIVRGDGDGFSQRPWQPLHENQWTDTDGDALRLAVRLAMTVRQEPSAAAAGWGADCLYGAPTVDGRGPWFWKEWLSNNQDPLAATRLAITRAAAQTGKVMP